jgi:BCD family chlorophyll transporter-like MFS transporter
VLHLGVGATTTLTALMAGGTLVAFALAARVLNRGADPHRLAGYGAVVGLFAFAGVILAAPMDSALLFRASTTLIGFGAGLFSVGTLTAAMNLECVDANVANGLLLGAWGAVQATCAGIAVALGGGLRDGVAALAAQGVFGPAVEGPAAGYGFVYNVEIGLLFATLVAIGPLARHAGADGARRPQSPAPFGLAEFPG